ncbi:uncharacterized protein [Argopecten irradians]|uniref:uncharacterized protein n=1 Tax=Argopecten irradians TaxID=31199 RepID=UPI00371673F2
MPTGRSTSTSNKTKSDRRGSGVSVSQMDSTDDKLDHINQVLLTLMTKDDMIFHMDKLRDEIRQENKEMIERLEGKVFDLENENERLRETVGQLETSVQIAEERIVHMARRDNALEQQGRKNSIRIVGLNSDRTETAEVCVEKCAKFFRDNLKVDVKVTDIDIAHRLGPRSTICKFVRRMKKFEVMKARKELKGKKIYIFEDLTQENQQILKRAYELDCVENSWSIEGKLFVKLRNGKKRRISDDTILTSAYLLNDANFAN